MIHLTRPEDVIVHSSGWARVTPDFEVPCIPGIDACCDLPDGRPMFARVSHETEEICNRRFGAELITMNVARAAWEIGVRLKPVQLVRTQEDTHHMMGRAFCETHDTRVWNQLDAIDWDEATPVGNIGKFWLKPTSSNARNGGWFDPHGVPVQPGGPGSEHHGRRYTDYSQLYYPMRFVGSGSIRDAIRRAGQTFSALFRMFTAPASVTATSSPTTFGEALLAAARADLGVREQGGHNRGPEVDAWLRALDVTPPGNWCAAAVAKWLRDASAATGMTSPIPGSPGAKATMAQLQTVGRWHGRDTMRAAARSGSIVVWHRGDPASWTGHIGIVETVNEQGMATIEGNSGPAGDRVARMRRLWSDPLLLGIGVVD